MDQKLIENLGPLAPLAGTWEGDKGDDTAPDDDPKETEINKYRERLVFDPFGPVNNHAQVLYGLRYSTTAWRLEEESPFHEELGYWLWDPAEKQVTAMFHRSTRSGGYRGRHCRNRMPGNSTWPPMWTPKPTAFVPTNSWTGSSKQFAMSSMSLFTTHNSFSYEEDTQLKIKGQKELFSTTSTKTS